MYVIKSYLINKLLRFFFVTLLTGCVWFLCHLWKVEVLTFMVVVDVAGFQAMWRVCQPADLYMRERAGGAGPLWFNFSESCFHCNVSCNQFEMSPPPPGGTMSLQLQSRPAKIRKAATTMSFQLHFALWLGPGFCQIETVVQLHGVNIFL